MAQTAVATDYRLWFQWVATAQTIALHSGIAEISLTRPGLVLGKVIEAAIGLRVTRPGLILGKVIEATIGWRSARPGLVIVAKATIWRIAIRSRCAGWLVGRER